MSHPYLGGHKSSQAARLARIAGGGGSSSTPRLSGTASSSPVKSKGLTAGLSVPGSPTKPRADRYARGGKVKGKGNNVNVIIAMPSAAKGDASAPLASSPMPAPKPPMVMPPPPMGGPKPAMIGGPAMPMRRDGGRVPGFKRGGAVKKRIGLKSGGVVPMTAGAGDGEGRLQKAALARRK